ncbi:MAG: FeoB-associated Cys-rich membrane protein [Clostridia bacterium]
MLLGFKISDIIAILIIALIIGLAILYIIKAKKSGQKCIGCPYGKTCGKKQNTNQCSCHCKCHEQEEQI